MDQVAGKLVLRMVHASAHSVQHFLSSYSRSQWPFRQAARFRALINSTLLKYDGDLLFSTLVLSHMLIANRLRVHPVFVLDAGGVSLLRFECTATSTAHFRRLVDHFNVDFILSGRRGLTTKLDRLALRVNRVILLSYHHVAEATVVVLQRLDVH